LKRQYRQLSAPQILPCRIGLRAKINYRHPHRTVVEKQVSKMTTISNYIAAQRIKIKPKNVILARKSTVIRIAIN